MTRKRQSRKDLWIDNQAKKCRAEGIEGYGRKGKIEMKEMKPSCSDKCRFKCSEKLTEQERETAFKEYYSLGSTTKQWECINNWVSIKDAKEKDEESLEIAQVYGKKTSDKKFYNFTLPSETGPVSICRTMFLNTLSTYEFQIYSQYSFFFFFNHIDNSLA